MHVEIITLSFSPESRRFDDRPLRAFLERWEPVSLKPHFFTWEGLPYLVLLLVGRARSHTTSGSSAVETLPTVVPQGKRRHDYRQEVGPENLALFEALRVWRRRHSKTLGVPAFAVFSDSQLVQIARQRPATLTALTQIQGIGEVKKRRFGREVLDLLARYHALGQGEPAANNEEPRDEP